MKIHLKVIYGCDDRHAIAKFVPELCHQYVDSVTIYNCGVKAYGDKFINLPPNCRVEYFDGFMGDMESVLRGILQSVPEGDWFMWLDADEIPSQLLLDNIRQDTEYFDANVYIACRIPTLGHQNGLVWQPQ